MGGAASALVSPLLLGAIDPSHAPLTQGQTAAVGAFATLASGLAAGLAGANAQGGAQAGENVALNNDLPHWALGNPAQAGQLGSSSNGSSLAPNPFSKVLAAACAGGTQPCNTQVLQAMMQGQGTNADQALGTMSSAAPYVGGVVGVTLGGIFVGPEIVAGCAANPVLCFNQGSIFAAELS